MSVICLCLCVIMQRWKSSRTDITWYLLLDLLWTELWSSSNQVSNKISPWSVPSLHYFSTHQKQKKANKQKAKNCLRIHDLVFNIIGYYYAVYQVFIVAATILIIPPTSSNSMVMVITSGSNQWKQKTWRQHDKYP